MQNEWAIILHVAKFKKDVLIVITRNSTRCRNNANGRGAGGHYKRILQGNRILRHFIDNYNILKERWKFLMAALLNDMVNKFGFVSVNQPRHPEYVEILFFFCSCAYERTVQFVVKVFEITDCYSDVCVLSKKRNAPVGLLQGWWVKPCLCNVNAAESIRHCLLVRSRFVCGGGGTVFLSCYFVALIILKLIWQSFWDRNSSCMLRDEWSRLFKTCWGIAALCQKLKVLYVC